MSVTDHHHRSTTKATQKHFKTRHSTKSALRERAKGKLEQLEKGQRRTPHQQVLSKLDRRNQAKQKRLAHQHELAKAVDVFSGREGAPRNVAVISLCKQTSPSEVVKRLNQSVDIEQEVPSSGLTRVHVDRFKQKLQYVLPRRELLPCLDACRVADYVLLILTTEEEVDQLGELIIRTIENQGISNVITVVEGLDDVQPPKRRQQLLASLKSYITHFFPLQDKIHSVQARQECLNVVRTLCTTNPRGIRWRDERSWMLVEEVMWDEESSTRDSATDSYPYMAIVGTVRGRPLKADRLVQLGDWGDFQISEIFNAAVSPSSRPHSEMMVDARDGILEQATQDQDTLEELAPEDVVMDDSEDKDVASQAYTERRGVLLDDHHYFSDEDSEAPVQSKRLPRGTSNYQAAWYVDDISDSASDLDDYENNAGDIYMDDSAPSAVDGLGGRENGEDVMAATEGATSEYPASEMFLDRSPDQEEEEIEAYRARRKAEAEDDMEFPDEIELPPNVLARERLARYRGLKDLRTSRWEVDNDRLYEPENWNRLLEIANYRAARSRILRESLVGGVPPGTRVKIRLRDVPPTLKEKYDASQPLCIFSLLRHEHKRTAVNLSITLQNDYARPLKSKEEILVQCGPRRMVVNPIFSETGNRKNNVHKFHRYLHPGSTAIVSFIGPVTWGSVPVVYLKLGSPHCDDGAPMETPDRPTLQLVGTGTSLAPDRSRVVAKRVILIGHPYKIHKRLVTVRYMFFNAEDVAWFKALQLWTKRGRSGFIKESLGTHGYYKATFDAKINPQDAIGVSLYKRVWPRNARMWTV